MSGPRTLLNRWCRCKAAGAAAMMLLALVQGAFDGVATAATAAPFADDSGSQVASPPQTDPSAAADPAQVQERLRELIARMPEKDVRDALVRQLMTSAAPEPGEVGTTAPGMITTFRERLETARERLREMVLAVPDLPSIIPQMQMIVTGGSGPSPGALALFMALIFATGFAAESLFCLLFSRFSEPPSTQSAQRHKLVDRLCILALRLVRDVLALGVFGIVAATVFFVFWQGHEPTRITISTVFWAMITIRLITAAARFALAPQAPTLRLPPIDTRTARQQYHRLLLVAGSIVAGYSFAELVRSLGVTADGGQRSALTAVLTLGVFLVAIAVVWLNRRAVSTLILRAGGQRDDDVGRLRHIVAANWHVFVTCAMVALWLMLMGKRILTGESIAAPLIWSLCVLLAIPVLDWILVAALSSMLGVGSFHRHARMPGEGGPPAPNPQGDLPPHSPGDLHEGDMEVRPVAHADRALQARFAYRDVLVRNLRIVLAVIAGIALARVWHVDMESMAASGVGETLTESILDIAVTLILASAAWGIIKTAIRFAVPDRPDEGDDADAGEIGGKGGTRVETIVPLLGKFLLVGLVVVVVFILLSELGVDIAPLIAGAGVVGLAIGFGAQTLVKDILSGLFFLIDDAFRVGEYIDVGTVKGMVERISIRSLRLRHHLGAVHTIPFGEIRHLTNFSRDWAIMKLEMRVPFDTDLEKMRKIIKKVGQEMMTHPEYGPNFLQPVKSQGVHRMDDSAFIIRVKFMAKPGEQFVLRREIFRRVQEAFANAGIHFAPRRVIVDGAAGAESAAAAASAALEQTPERAPASSAP